MKDPIVAEIHKHRKEHAREFSYDLDAIYDDLRNHEREAGAVSGAVYMGNVR
jgi:hypothetical protein